MLRAPRLAVMLLVGFASLAAVWWSRRGEAAAGGGAGAPVIVELFSSEGCSSCPPADAYLAQLDRTQPIDGVHVIAIEEHVDYWDDLGWKDPYGNPAFAVRQRAYAAALDDHRVFTPELVIDGQFVAQNGNEEIGRRMMQEAARQAKARIALALEGDRLRIDVSQLPASQDDTAEIWLAITESGLASDVKRGENAGRHLVHAPIARELRRVARINEAVPETHAATTLDRARLALSSSARNARAVRAIVFVQLAKNRRIIGASAIDLNIG